MECRRVLFRSQPFPVFPQSESAYIVLCRVAFLTRQTGISVESVYFTSAATVRFSFTSLTMRSKMRNAKRFKFTTSVLYEHGRAKRLKRSCFVSMPCVFQKTPRVTISMIGSANVRPRDGFPFPRSSLLLSFSNACVTVCFRVLYGSVERFIPDRALERGFGYCTAKWNFVIQSERGPFRLVREATRNASASALQTCSIWPISTPLFARHCWPL